MAIFNYTPQSDGTTGDVADINVPFAQIAALLNAGLTLDNITPGSLDDTIATAETRGGWSAFTTQPTTTSGYNKGAKEFEVVFPSTDLTSVISPGMKLKVTRNTTPPSQCANFTAASTQYANKATPTGITFTDDFTVEAWVKLTSYTTGCILGRLDVTGANGWGFYIGATGNVFLFGKNGGAANLRSVTSLTRVPLGRWVHIAASLDMSGYTTATCKIFINGEDVPVQLSTGGTNPTALVQGTDLGMGRPGTYASDYIDGEVQDVRLWNVVRTSTQIRDNMCQQIVGNETNNIGYWKLNGNFNDSNANANNLTAQNSASSTTNDTAMNSVEYADIRTVTYSSNTTVKVKAAPGYMIPNMTLTASAWSAANQPKGYPVLYEKAIDFVPIAQTSNQTTTSATFVDMTAVSFSYTSGPQPERLELEFSAVWFLSGAANSEITLSIASIDITPTIFSSATVSLRLGRTIVWSIPANTTVTIKGRMKVSGGATLTVNQNADGYVPAIHGRAIVQPM